LALEDILAFDTCQSFTTQDTEDAEHVFHGPSCGVTRQNGC
jgi:hypothetical protein